MVELWLNFKDENGKPKRLLVEGEKFVIGRTSENDLSIPLGNLSRQHAKIERFADIFVVSDCGSSNGTTLNGEKMSEPVALKNKDKLNLGGGFEIEVEVISDEENANNSGGSGGGSANGEDDEDDEQSSAASAMGASNSSGGSSTSGSGSSGMPSGFFILAPILCICLLLIGGILFLIFGGKTKESEIAGNRTNIPYSNPTSSRKSETPKPEETASPSGTETTSTPGGTSTPVGSSTSTPEPTSTTDDPPDDGPTPKPIGDTQKVKISSALFLRKIAERDPNAFLTTPQVAIVNSQTESVKKLSNLAENIKDAKKNAAKIEEIARSKNLKPQFLAVAAITELGNQRGDVVAKATEMSGVLADLVRELSNEVADDMLLVIAAYDQGKAGDTTKMRLLVTKISTELSLNPAVVRSVWYLHDKKQITDAQFEKALRFLAIGTITQNPKDFNVNAEALSFN